MPSPLLNEQETILRHRMTRNDKFQILIGGIAVENNNHRKGFNGVLPASAPLANPYVPFQQVNPPTYAPPKAFIRGTLFPGLDLPYLGMVNNKEKTMTPLTELQTIAFVLQELALYLDTHRDDTEAYELFCEYKRLYEDGKKRYEAKYGPLVRDTACCCKEYRWLDDPWPWEYAANRGV